MDSMVLERFEESIGARFFNGDEQSARSLGIIKQISEFLGDIFREDRASFDELAIILQTTGQKSGLRRCNGSGQILDARVIETKGYAAAERHLSCVPEDSEAGYVARFFADRLGPLRHSQISARHREWNARQEPSRPLRPFWKGRRA